MNLDKNHFHFSCLFYNCTWEGWIDFRFCDIWQWIEKRIRQIMILIKISFLKKICRIFFIFHTTWTLPHLGLLPRLDTQTIAGFSFRWVTPFFCREPASTWEMTSPSTFRPIFITREIFVFSYFNIYINIILITHYPQWMVEIFFNNAQCRGNFLRFSSIDWLTDWLGCQIWHLRWLTEKISFSEICPSWIIQ